MAEKNYKIHNIFLGANYEETSFDLSELKTELEQAEYNPKKFPGLIYRPENLQTTLLVFKSGKVSCLGAKNLEKAKEAVEFFTDKLHNLGVNIGGYPETEIKNMVASAEFDRGFDLSLTAKKVQSAEYNPKNFPGVIFKPKNVGATFLLFQSGRVISMGAKSEEHIRRGVAEISEIQKEIRLKKLRRRLGAFSPEIEISPEYLKWNELLVQEFYSKDQEGSPVFLSIDEHKIEQLENEVEESLPKFREAIKSLGSPDEIIEKFLSMGMDWSKNGEGVPPFIAGLGFCVLAASKMGSAPEIPPHAYYYWLNKELGREREGSPPGFEKMHLLWKMLNYWLEKKCDGERGAPTARQVVGNRHVAWPLSQALFREEADKRELLRLREWLGIEKESPSPEEVAQGFSIWLNQEGADTRLASLLPAEPSSEDLNHIAEHLIDLLPDLEDYDKVPRQNKGQCGYLHLHKSHRNWEDVDVYLSWRAENVERGNYRAILNPIGEEVDLRVLTTWADIELNLSESGLESFVAEPKEFESRSRLDVNLEKPLIFVQGEGRGRPGWWIQSGKLGARDEEHCILCKSEVAEEVASLLSRKDGEVDAKTQPDWLPEGYVFFPKVIVNPNQKNLFPDYTREESTSWELKEGLKIEKNVWLKGALPKVYAPGELKVTVQDNDGNNIKSDHTPFSLDDFGLSEGSYRLQPNTGRSKTLIIRAPTWPPFPLLSSEAAFEYYEVTNPFDEDTIALSGSNLRGADNLPMPPILDDQNPAVILGKSPKEFKKFSKNSSEEELAEDEIDFDPQWKITLKDGDPFLIDSLKPKPDPPEFFGPKASEKEKRRREEWADYLSGEVSTKLLTSGQIEIFGEYTRVAEKIKEEKEGTVYAGDKSAKEYVKAVFTQIRNGHDEVALKARGKFISTAVDTAEIVKRRLLSTKIKEISTRTEELEKSSGTSSVSEITIQLSAGENSSF